MVKFRARLECFNYYEIEISTDKGKFPSYYFWLLNSKNKTGGKIIIDKLHCS
jgi:hypothetical protein